MIRGMGAMNRLFGCVAAATLLALAGGARAETLTFSPATPTMSLGTIVAAPSNGAFNVTVSPSGSVTTTNGAVRLQSTTVITPTVSIVCNGGGGGGNCKNPYTITILGTTSSGGRAASIGSLQISNFSGSNVTLGSTNNSPGNRLIISVTGTQNSWSLTFKLGAGLDFVSGSTTGNTTVNYTLQVAG